jgi:hypothetical protein
MGLNAVVYRNRERLPFDPDELGAVFDNDTGECYIDHDISGGLDGDVVVALSRRLGNVSAVKDLADAVERSLGPNSLLRSKVLYNGSHAGDVIGVDSLQHLSAELQQLRGRAPVCPEPAISEFIQGMEDLLRAALDEGNPIVFT